MQRLLPIAMLVIVLCLGWNTGISAELCGYGNNFDPGKSSSTLSVINTTTNTVAATVTVRARSSFVAAHSNGSRLYVTHDVDRGNFVSMINTATNTVINTIVVTGVDPEDAVVRPDGKRLYVVAENNDKVAVINIETNPNTELTTVGVPKHPAGIAVNPIGSRTYVTNCDVDLVTVLDTATNVVLATSR